MAEDFSIVLAHHSRSPLRMKGGTEFRFLGEGIHTFNDIDTHALGDKCARHVAGERATHVFLRKRA